jgi:hypothetical protein
MATQRSSFDKLQRERAKKQKAADKRERRAERAAGTAAGPNDEELLSTPPGEEIPPAELMRRVEALHERYAAGGMELEDFEEAKAELMARLTVD